MPDLRCYFVTGAGTSAEIVRIAAAAARGGAGVVQVRSKPISARDLYHPVSYTHLTLPTTPYV